MPDATVPPSTAMVLAPPPTVIGPDVSNLHVKPEKPTKPEWYYYLGAGYVMWRFIIQPWLRGRQLRKRRSRREFRPSQH